MRRLSISIVSLAFALVLELLGGPRVASADSCQSNWLQNKYAGNSQVLAGPVGIAASIQAYNPTLCTPTPTLCCQALSSAWVDIAHPYTTNGDDLLQIGFDKCRGSTDCNGNPENQLYIFWSYGREPNGICGPAEIMPTAHKLPGTPSGTPRFKIERQTVDPYNFQLFIDNVLQSPVIPPDWLMLCWDGGATEVDAFNEVDEMATQSGGRFGDKQDFRDVRYKTGGTWSLMTRGLGDECDHTDAPHQQCIISTTDSNNFYSWDDRYP